MNEITWRILWMGQVIALTETQPRTCGHVNQPDVTVRMERAKTIDGKQYVFLTEIDVRCLCGEPIQPGRIEGPSATVIRLTGPVPEVPDGPVTHWPQS